MTSFQGWRIGHNLTEEQAEELEPLVDLLEESLIDSLTIPPLYRTVALHDVLLRLVQYIGGAASTVIDIGWAIHAGDGTLADTLAQNLRTLLVRVVALSVTALYNLDNRIKAGNDDKENNQS